MAPISQMVCITGFLTETVAVQFEYIVRFISMSKSAPDVAMQDFVKQSENSLSLFNCGLLIGWELFEALSTLHLPS